MQPNPYIALVVGIVMLVSMIALFAWLSRHEDPTPGAPTRHFTKKQARKKK